MSASLEWAAAISPRHDAIRVGDQNNEYRKEASWPQHEPNHPWAVYLADDGMYPSLVLDFDHGANRDPRVDAREAFWYLEESGFAPVLAESGGGGYHVLARLPVPTHANVIGPIVSNLHSFWPSLDISPMVNPRTGCIRPPGSVHRSGHRSRVIAGSLPAFASTPTKDALDRLESLTQSPPSATPAKVASQSKPISDKVHRLLRYGDTEQAYPSRSEMIQAIAFGYVNAGKSVTDLFRALRDKANLGGVKVQRMPLKRAEQYVERSYLKALSFEPRRTAPAHLMREIGALRQTFDHADWSGLAGATDRTVADVLLTMAERLETMTFGMSERELAERAAIDKETARRSQHRLVEAGFIKQVAPSVGRDAAIWKLQLAATQLHKERRGRVLSGGNLQDDLPEAFRWGTGLGHNAYRIWLAAEHLHTPRELAVHLGIDATTVSRRLKILQQIGLVTCDAERRQWVRVMRDLDVVAAELGVQGSRARQKKYHQSERNSTPVERSESGGLIFMATRRKRNK